MKLQGFWDDFKEKQFYFHSGKRGLSMESFVTHIFTIFAEVSIYRYSEKFCHSSVHLTNFYGISCYSKILSLGLFIS